MGQHRCSPTKSGLYLSFATLALSFACSSSSVESGGPTAGAGNDAGTAGEGGSNVAGANASGAGSSAASAGAPTAGSDCGECFVAEQCLDHCGGTVVYLGCCACVAPAVNKNSCPKP
jgi:hypothetical protein